MNGFFRGLREKGERRNPVESPTDSARLVNNFFCEALNLPSNEEAFRWGFRELRFYGEQQWSLYDRVFPRAIYINLIRHPFQNARSQSDFLLQPFTRKALVYYLELWTRIINDARRFAPNERYIEIKCEHMFADPLSTVRRITDFCDLSAHGAEFPGVVNAATRNSSWPTDPSNALASVPGLAELMSDLDYVTPLDSDPSQAAVDDGFDEAVSLFAGQQIRLSGPYHKDLACYTVPVPFEAIADCVDDLWRSPLLLFEDGRPLGPAHTLHSEIRAYGMGRYSHWGSVLYFSASDNSDPNTNGREYRISIEHPAKKDAT